MKQITITVIGLVAVILVSLGLWYVGRKIHYAVAYKSMVEQTIREMVKPEALAGDRGKE